MRDDENVLASLQLHDDGFQSNDNIPIRLSTEIAVVVLVLVALRKVLGVFLLDFAVGQAVANTRIEFVQRFPFEFLKSEEACGLDGALQCGGPNGKPAAIANRLRNKARKSMRIGISALRKICVSSNLARKVVLRLAVLRSLVKVLKVVTSNVLGTARSNEA